MLTDSENTGEDPEKRPPRAGAAGDMPFYEAPSHLLRCCHQSAVGVFLTQCGSLELTPPQFAALAALEAHGPLEQAALAGATALDRTTVAVVLKNLARRELVEIAPSTLDRRAKIAQLTGMGRDVLTIARDRAAQAQETIMAPLTARERRQLLKLLAKMAEGNNRHSRAPYRRPPLREA
jgi:DNA-binding MarR family transcriptional regulator